MLYSIFDVGDKLNALVDGYSYRGTVLDVKEKTYIIKLAASDIVEVLKSQCFNCSYYWYK